MRSEHATGEREESERRTFRALRTDVEVRVDDRRLLPGLANLVASYAPSGAGPWLRYHLQCHPLVRLLRDGAEVARGDNWFDALALFELDLYQQLVVRLADHWILHAAAVCRGPGAVLLVGPPGTGKSTLALALTVRGASYLADDCAAIAADGAVDGITRPIRLVPGARLPLLEEGFAVHLDHPPDPADGYRLVHPPAGRLARGAPLRAFVAIRHAPAETPSCRRLSAGEALCALWPHSRPPAAEVLELATALVTRYPCYALVTRDVETACASIDEVGW